MYGIRDNQMSHWIQYIIAVTIKKRIFSVLTTYKIIWFYNSEDCIVMFINEIFKSKFIYIVRSNKIEMYYLCPRSIY
jgi:hypothetical protein